MERTVEMTQEQTTTPLIHARLWGELALGFCGSVLELSDSPVVNVRCEKKLGFWSRLSRLGMTMTALNSRG